MALKGSDYIGIRAWLADLTYAEAHAFEIGFAAWALYGLTGHVVLLGLGVTVVMIALGEKALDNEVLRYLVAEAHYALSGSVAGLVFGLLVDVVV